MRQKAIRAAAFECLRNAAFEERVNRCTKGADFWRERAALWFRRMGELA